MADRMRRERLLTFLLLPAIVISVMVLATVMFRSSFQLEKLREQSVVEATLLLANEKADRLDKRIIEQDNVVRSTIDIGERAEFGAKRLETAAVQTPTVRAALLVDMGSPDRPVVAVASRAPGPENERFRKLLVYFMLPDMNLEVAPVGQLRHLHKSYRGVSYLLSHWAEEHEGRRYLLVVWHDVPRRARPLPGALRRRSAEPGERRRRGGAHRLQPPLGRGGMTLGRQFETTLYKWTLNVSMASAEELAAAVSRRRVLEMRARRAFDRGRDGGPGGDPRGRGARAEAVARAEERLRRERLARAQDPARAGPHVRRALQSGRVDGEEKRRQYLGIIVSESERLGALIENVLGFSPRSSAASRPTILWRATSRTSSPEPWRVPRARERDQVALEYEAEPSLPVVRLDERAVEIAVINLVTTRSSTPRGQARSRCDVTRDRGKVKGRGRRLRSGISPEERKRIFERGSCAARAPPASRPEEAASALRSSSTSPRRTAGRFGSRTTCRGAASSS